MGLRRLLPLLALLLALGLTPWLRLAPTPPADAQGVGIYSRPDCSTLTGPVAGSTWCFDSTTRVLKVWDGTLWATTTLSNNGASGFGGLFLVADCTTIVSPLAGRSFCFDATANTLKAWTGTAWLALASATGSNTALTVTAVNGIGVNAISGGTGIALSGISTLAPSTSPAVRGESAGYYAGLFYNITDAGTDLANANNIGLVAQSIYSNAGYFQQGGAPGSPGDTLARNSIYPALYVTRVTGSLGGFNFTQPLLRVDDTTASSGNLMDLKKQTVTTMIVDGRGRLAIAATATGVNAPVYTLDVKGETAVAAVLRGNPGGASNATQLRFWGKTDAAELWAIGTDIAAGTGTRTFDITNVLTGNTAVSAGAADGVSIGAPTGGDKGLGTVNAQTAYYANNNQFINASGTLINRTFVFANLNLVLTANGMQVYCSDCTAASALDQTCVGGGTGNLAVRINGVNKCVH